ncbi:hypothetical protein ACOMHN_021825 [Nucella lapillus]
MDEGKHASPAQPAKRMLRGHQPARAILLDLSHTVEIQVWHRVLSALHGLLSLVCNMAGPPRIPLISFYVLDAYPEVILPFSPPKGNLCRMLSALRDVKTYVEERQVWVTPRPPACVHLGVVEACGQYRRHLHAMGHLQGGGGSLQMDQLEVVVLTGATSAAARALLDCQDTQLDLTLLKRLVVAVLISNSLDDADSPHSSNSNPRETEDSGIMDIVHLDTDRSSLQKFVYTWLLDSSSDSEHLHLMLPPASPVDGDLSLKCDIVERIINPAQLPHHEFFNLHSDSAHCKTVFPCPSKAAGLTVPVYALKVIGSIPLHSLCDSLLFGLPLIVQATSCWRIDWGEVEKNTANFHALLPLIVQATSCWRIDWEELEENTASVHALCKELSLKGMFVLMPAPGGCSLLLKALATRELLLPATWAAVGGGAAAAAATTPGEGGEENTDSENSLKVQSSLTQVPELSSCIPLSYSSGLVEVPELSSYNPLSYSSGLVEVLLSQAAPKQQAVRPRPAAKRKAQPAKQQQQQDLVGHERTCSEISPHLTPAAAGGGSRGSRDVGVSPSTTRSYCPSPATTGQSSVIVGRGRHRVTTRMPDGFFVELE